MTFRHRHLVAAVGLTLALVSCGAPPTAPPAGSGSDNGPSKFQQYEGLNGQERRDQLIKDAKAEGEVSLYTSMTSDVAGTVTRAFTDQTGIKVNLYRADSETVLQRILQEARANHADAEVVETAASGMASLGKEQLVEPYTGERRDLVGAEGKKKKWTADRYNLFAPSWNTTKVPAGDQPTSWEDLANPKWDGALAMELNDYDWYLTLYEYWQQHGKSTTEIDKLFADMANGAKVVKGHTVMGEMLSAGQYSVAASNYSYIVPKAVDKGAPVAYQPFVQPVIARPQGAAPLKSVPHPAAALLFQDWLTGARFKVFVDQGLTPSSDMPHGKDPLEGTEVIEFLVTMLLDKQKEWSDRYDALLSRSDKVGG